VAEHLAWFGTCKSSETPANQDMCSGYQWWKRCLSFRQREDLSRSQCKVSDRFVGLIVDSLLKSYASQPAGRHKHVQMHPPSVVPAVLRSTRSAYDDLRSPKRSALYVDQRRCALQVVEPIAKSVSLTSASAAPRVWTRLQAMCDVLGRTAGDP
jgi:hypothetical protein